MAVAPPDQQIGNLAVYGLAQIGSKLPLKATNDYNDAGILNTKSMVILGTEDAPLTDKSALVIIQKTSNAAKLGVNGALYVSHVKMGTLQGNEASAVVGESVDKVGGAQSSNLGGRFSSLLSGGSDGSPVGVSGTATIAPTVTSYQNACGGELACCNLLPDVPKDRVNGPIMDALLLGSTGTGIIDAFVGTNPYANAAWNGVHIRVNSVKGAAFRSSAVTEYAIDGQLGRQTKAFARVPSSMDNQAPTIDCADATVTNIANGASALIGGGSAGVLIVANKTGQTCAMYAGDAATGFVLIGGSPQWVAPTKTPAAGQCSVALNNDGLRLYNGAAGSNFTTMFFKMR